MRTVTALTAALLVAAPTPACAEPLHPHTVAVDSLLWRWESRTVYVEGSPRGWDTPAATREWARIRAGQPSLTPTRACPPDTPCVTLRAVHAPDADWYGTTRLTYAAWWPGDPLPRAGHVTITLNTATDPECRHTVLTHELGHALGVGHASVDSNDLMDTVLGNGDCRPGRLAYPIGDGDRHALRDLYGGP